MRRGWFGRDARGLLMDTIEIVRPEGAEKIAKLAALRVQLAADLRRRAGVDPARNERARAAGVQPITFAASCIRSST